MSERCKRTPTPKTPSGVESLHLAFKLHLDVYVHQGPQGSHVSDERKHTKSGISKLDQKW